MARKARNYREYFSVSKPTKAKVIKAKKKRKSETGNLVTQVKVANARRKKEEKTLAQKQIAMLTKNDLAKMEHVARLPNPNLAKKIYSKDEKKRIKKSTETFVKKAPAVAGFLEGSNLAPTKLKTQTEQQTGKKLNTKKAESTTAYKVGEMAGIMGSFVATGGLAEGAIAKGILKTSAKRTAKKAGEKAVKETTEKVAKEVAKAEAKRAKAITKANKIKDIEKRNAIKRQAGDALRATKNKAKTAGKKSISDAKRRAEKEALKKVPSKKKVFLAKRGADAIAGVPINASLSSKEGDFGKNMALNTGLDVVAGTVMGGAAKGISKLGDKGIGSLGKKIGKYFEKQGDENAKKLRELNTKKAEPKKAEAKGEKGTTPPKKAEPKETAKTVAKSKVSEGGKGKKSPSEAKSGLPKTGKTTQKTPKTALPKEQKVKVATKAKAKKTATKDIKTEKATPNIKTEKATPDIKTKKATKAKTEKLLKSGKAVSTEDLWKADKLKLGRYQKATKAEPKIKVYKNAPETGLKDVWTKISPLRKVNIIEKRARKLKTYKDALANVKVGKTGKVKALQYVESNNKRDVAPIEVYPHGKRGKSYEYGLYNSDNGWEAILLETGRKLKIKGEFKTRAKLIKVLDSPTWKAIMKEHRANGRFYNEQVAQFKKIANEKIAQNKEIISKATKGKRIAMLNEEKPVAVIGKGKNAIVVRSGKVRAVKFYEKRNPQSERIGANPAEVKSNRETLPKRKERLKSFVNSYRRAFVNSLGVFDDIAKATKSKELSAQTNAMRTTTKTIDTTLGDYCVGWDYKNKGKPVVEICSPINESGKMNEFSEYLYHRLNIKRVRWGKDTFGKDTYTAKDSKDIIAKLTKDSNGKLTEQGKQFEAWAKDVYRFYANQKQILIDAGVWRATDEKTTAEQVAEAVDKEIELSFKSNTLTALEEQIADAYVSTYRIKTLRLKGKKAVKGSERDILPIDEQMTAHTTNVWETCQLSELMKSTLKALNLPVGSRQMFDVDELAELQIPQIVKNKEGEVVTSMNQITGDMVRKLDDKNPDFIKYNANYFADGKQYKVEVTKDMYDTIQAHIGATNPDWLVSLVARTSPFNSVFKKLVTSYSPVFIPKNFLRDSGDGLFYSTDTPRFLMAQPKAVKEVTFGFDPTKKDEISYMELYRGGGGFSASFFETSNGIKYKTGVFKSQLDRVERTNQRIEQLPRMAEFIQVLDKELDGRPLKEATKEMIDKAILASSDITVNFGRSGNIGKLINRGIAPFFNPAMQGTSKIIRTIADTEGAKAYTMLMAKATVFGIAPSVVNELYLADDEDYRRLTDREKMTYYLFPIGDHKFVKIPKGRVMSVLSSLFQAPTRVLASGDPVEVVELGKTAIDQVAPISPFNTLLTPIGGAITNTTWYGGGVETIQEREDAPELRFDEGTSSIFKAIGKKLNLSPKKIQYVFEQETGVLADFVLAYTTQEAKGGSAPALAPFYQAFVTDSVRQNDLSMRFYKQIEKANHTKSLNPTNKTSKEVSRLSAYQNRVADLNNAKKAVERMDIPNEEKVKLTNVILKQKNELFKNALEGKKSTPNGHVRDLDAKVKALGEKYVIDEITKGSNTYKGIYNTYVKKGGNDKDFYNGYKEIYRASKISKVDGKPSNSIIAYGLAKAKSDNKLYEAFGVDRYKGISEALVSYEITPRNITKLKKKVDADDNGYVSKTEAVALLDSTDYSAEEKSALYRVIGASWNSINPYGDYVAYNRLGKGQSGSSGRSSGGRSSGRRSGTTTASSEAQKKVSQMQSSTLSRQLSSIKDSTSLTKTQKKKLLEILARRYA